MISYAGLYHPTLLLLCIAILGPITVLSMFLRKKQLLTYRLLLAMLGVGAVLVGLAWGAVTGNLIYGVVWGAAVGIATCGALAVYLRRYVREHENPPLRW